MQFRPDLVDAAREVVELAQRKGLSLITAEPCTSRLVSLILSQAPGAGLRQAAER
jgi:nicotinamide mononucleotide (NMN) deamidase PncC